MFGLVLAGIAVFVAYIVYALNFIGYVPQSLSLTYYLLPKSQNILFTAMMWAMGFLLIVPILEVTNPNLQFLGFLAIGGILFVGAAPCFRDKFESKVHCTAAKIAAVFSILWVALATPCWYFIPIGFGVCWAIAYKTDTMTSAKTWWWEMCAFLSTFLTLIAMTI